MQKSPLRHGLRRATSPKVRGLQFLFLKIVDVIFLHKILKLTALSPLGKADIDAVFCRIPNSILKQIL